MPAPVDSFITRWESSGAAERANYALFLTELCDLLDVPWPDPTSPDPEKNRYVFERAMRPCILAERSCLVESLTTFLRQIHDKIDAALENYGWGDLRRHDTPVVHSAPSPSSAHEKPSAMAHDKSVVPPHPNEAFEEEILTRLVALNHERAAEEKRGLVRWLRPEYQCPAAATASAPVEEQAEIDLDDPPVQRVTLTTAPPSGAMFTWPDKLPGQVGLIRSLVSEFGSDAKSLSSLFGRANKKREEQIEGIFETLRGLGL